MDIQEALSDEQRCIRAERFWRHLVKTFGEEDKKTVDALGKYVELLGNKQLTLSMRKKGAHLQEKYALLLEKIRGPEDKSVLIEFNKAVVRYAEIHAFYDSLRCARRVVEAQRRIDMDDDDTITALENLSFVYLLQGDFRQGLAVDEEILQILIRRLGETSDRALDALHKVTMVYNLIGNKKKTLATAEREVQLNRDRFGSDGEQTVEACRNLARYLRRFGMRKEELIQRRGTWITLRQTLGDDHERTLEVYGEFCEAVYECCNSLDCPVDREEALEIFQLYQSLAALTFGQSDERTLSAMSLTAGFLEKRQEWVESIRQREEILKILELAGAPSQKHSEQYLALARSYERAGYKEKAAALAGELLELLLPDKKENGKTILQLRAMLQRLGQEG